MSSFRLMLCIIGLITYVVAKQFTASDGDLVGLPPAPHLIGLTLNAAETESNLTDVVWIKGRSNAVRHVVSPTLPSEPPIEETMLNASARTRIEKAVQQTSLGATPRAEPN